METAASIVSLVAAVGTAVIGGVFFAFSTFVMAALARLPGTAGLAAMQAINVAVLNTWFLGTFLATALVAAMSVALRFVASGTSVGIAFPAIGALLYLAGAVGVTIACNVPRNNALAKLDPSTPSSDEPWRRYVREWTAWNHLRALASIAASACFILDLAT